MNVPVCLSKYFVNKQNIRSYSNILKSDYFIEDSVFYKHILPYGIISEKDVSTDLLNILLSLKNNLVSKSRKDFKSYFFTVGNSGLQSLNKEEVFQCCWKGVCDIIPNNFCGNYKNMKLFQQLVKIIVFSMKYQHFNMNFFVSKWNFSIYPWQTLPKSSVKQILLYILLWISKYVLSAMIVLNFYVTTCKLDSNENELHFFWKHQWQSFYDKKISDMILLKIIQKVDCYSLGKRLKKFRNLSENIKLKIMNKNIPRLHLVLKPNNDYRPLVKYKLEQNNLQGKYKIKSRLNFLKTLSISSSLEKIEIGFAKLYQQWLKMNKPKLYFVKADLSNAFGSVDRDKLINILRETHLKYQNTEKCVNIKKQMAIQYKDMVAELQKPLLIRSGSTIFEWKKGLVQGYKYSPALSELYYNYMDEIYFSEHLKFDNLKYFTRIVDDYLYITHSLHDAQLFLKALSNYKNVNYEKTIINFDYPNIKYSQEINFLGYSYNTKTLEVSRTNNVYLGQMCYKIAFTGAIITLNKFIENRIGQSGIQVNGHLFNLNYNNEELIWNHIFTTFCLSANKFCTILAIACEQVEMVNYMTMFKKRVAVKLTNNILETLLRNKPTDIMFMYCINHFRYLSWMAFSLCAQNTPKCSHLMPHIKDELAKCNCIFGKWREHASRINGSGECTKQAIKVICRRADLRNIIRRFHTLPDGFQCYNFKFK